MWNLIVGPLFETVNTVMKRWGPAEKMSEKDRADLEQQIQIELMKRDWSGVEKEYEDRANARALAAKESEKGNAFTMALSAVVRPVWGLSSLVVVAYPYLAGAMSWPVVAIDDATKQIIQTVIMFYFGGKTIEAAMTVMAKRPK